MNRSRIRTCVHNMVGNFLQSKQHISTYRRTLWCHTETLIWSLHFQLFPVGVVRFELTQPNGNRFTVCHDSPTSSYSQIQLQKLSIINTLPLLSDSNWDSPWTGVSQAINALPYFTSPRGSSVLLQILSIPMRDRNSFIPTLRGYVKTFTTALPFMLRRVLVFYSFLFQNLK